MKPMKTISLKLSETLDDQLNEVAKRREITKSDLVREALAEYLPDDAPAGSSFFAQTQDLAGCIDGPEDLSTNPKYLEGLGG